MYDFQSACVNRGQHAIYTIMIFYTIFQSAKFSWSIIVLQERAKIQLLYN